MAGRVPRRFIGNQGRQDSGVGAVQNVVRFEERHADAFRRRQRQIRGRPPNVPDLGLVQTGRFAPPAPAQVADADEDQSTLVRGKILILCVDGFVGSVAVKLTSSQLGIRHSVTI